MDNGDDGGRNPLDEGGKARPETESSGSSRSWLWLAATACLLLGVAFASRGDNVGAQTYLQQELAPPVRSFDSIVGYEEHKATVEDLVNKQKVFETVLLLSGPPGTGKRAFAEATANRLNAAFVELNLEAGLAVTTDEEDSMRDHGDELARRIKSLRRQDPKRPVVVFLDLGDVSLVPRTSNGQTPEEALFSSAVTRSARIGQQLPETEPEGQIEDPAPKVRRALAKVLVDLMTKGRRDLGTTAVVISHVGEETERVPRKLLPRELWKQVSLKFRYPTTKEREQMVRKKLGGDSEQQSMLAGAVSRMTHGMNGAHVSLILAESLASMVSEFFPSSVFNSIKVSILNFSSYLTQHGKAGDGGGGRGDEAPNPEEVEKVIEKLQQQQEVPKLLPWERVVVAFHEAGHVVSAWNSQEMEDVLEVTILPGGDGSLGCTKYASSGKLLLTNEMIQTKMVVALAGQMAEKEFFGDLTTGAQDDLQKLTRIAYLKVANFGLDPGFITAYPSQAAFLRSYSDRTADEIDARVSSILEAVYDRSSKLIKEHAGTVKMVAMSLLKQDLLTTDDINRLIGPRPRKGYKNWPCSIFSKAARSELLASMTELDPHALAETC